MGDLYLASDKRYEKMVYNRVGKSGLKFPAVSLGFWHNFGSKDNYDNMKAMCRKAFDLGITQFDLANNYGPVYGSAEENAGRILSEDFRPYRDELIVTSKAGYDMWPGPYGDWGSKKYLTASILNDFNWIMWIFSIITEWIRKLLWRRPWKRWPPSFTAVKPCMPVFPITTKSTRERHPPS